MEFLENNPKMACYLITGIISVALIIGGIAWSAGTVEPIQYGLKYNSISKSIDDTRTYTGGWYLIGPFNSFITYPSTNINVDFSDLPNSKSPPLSTRTGGKHQYSLNNHRLPCDIAVFILVRVD